MPECNAYVERFHGLCDQFFWSRQRFSGIADVDQHYPAFLQDFRTQYGVERLAGQTPTQARQTIPDGRVGMLPQDLTWTVGRALPLVAGRVHCIRRTDSQARLSVLGRYFTLNPDYRRTYIRATLDVAEQQVAFYYQEMPEQAPELVSTQPFPLPDEVLPWDASLAVRYLV
jgi:hypothetical protein